MKAIKIFLATIVVNCATFTGYLILFGIGDLGETIYGTALTIERMFFAIWFALIIHFSIKRLLTNEKFRTQLALGALGLTGALLLVQVLWSILLVFDNQQISYIKIEREFMERWGLYMPWTILTGIQIPMWDYLYARGRRKNASQHSL